MGAFNMGRGPVGLAHNNARAAVGFANAFRHPFRALSSPSQRTRCVPLPRLRGRDREGPHNKIRAGHPLPNPPPPGAPRDAPRRGDPVAGEGAHRVRGEAVHQASGEEEKGESAYFVWLNRGKESVVLDLARADDKALLAAILAKADVFVQNLKPGAVAKLGFALEELRRA